MLVDPSRARRELASSKSALSAAVVTSHWVLAGIEELRGRLWRLGQLQEPIRRGTGTLDAPDR